MMRHASALAILLILFVGLAGVYNVSTPLFEAPDELQHAAFVVWLADQGALPVVNPESPGPWEQEGTQPPLYYWIAASLVGKLPHAEAGNLAELNPYAGVGDPQRPDNKNRVLHDPEREKWPYTGNVLFMHLARAISTLMAVGTLGAVYCLGRIVFPGRRGVALGMVGLVAFTPQFLFLSASVNNDNLVILIASWVLVLLASWLRGPGLPGWFQLGRLGILLGLGLLAKFSGLLLWPLAVGTMLWLAWRAKQFRWLIPAALLVFGLALALSGWWFVRNYQLYGDLSGIGVHLQIMRPRRRLPSTANAMREFNGFRYSFWALFGWFNILAPDLFYRIMDGLAALGLVGFGLFLVRSIRRQPRWTRWAVAMLAAWVGLVALGVIQWTMRTRASQGRLLYPAWGAIALFLVVGWAEWVPRRLRRPLGIAALIGWGAWAAWCPARVLTPAYALPERVHSLGELAVEPSALQVRYDDCCELVGYVPPEGPIYAGERVPVTLIWRALDTAEQNDTLFVHALAADGQVVGQLDTYHGGGMYPTSHWRPGEIIVDTVYVPISWKAKGPAWIRFDVGLYEPSSLERLPALSADGRELDVVFAGEAALAPFQWPQLQTDPLIDTVFDQKIRLARVELSQPVARPGEVVTATLQWEALSRMKEDYIGFVHLVAPGGEVVAQDDHAPLNGRFPTRLWFEGVSISDPYRFELPWGLGEGAYELWGGLYRLESGDRLLAISHKTGKRWQDDLVHIGTLVITES